MSLLAKKYRQASFRGINFKVDSTDFEGGRRVVIDEYPLSDISSSKDLGRKKRDFSIEAYVNGENYEAQRDSLIGACEQFGSGKLIHPYLGSKDVVCTGCRVRESKAELGIAYFSLTFAETGIQQNPTQNIDQITKAKSTISELQDLCSVAFTKVYSVVNAPSFVTDAASSDVTGFTNVVQGEANKLNGIALKLADYTYQIRKMQSQVAALVRLPSQLAANFVTTLNNLLAILPGGSTQMKIALKGVSKYGVDFDLSNMSTSSRVAQATNSKALSDLSFQLVVGLLASEATDRTYASYQDADSDRQEILDLIDQILDSTGDDDVYRSFQRLKFEVSKAVPDTSKDLPSIVSIELESQGSSLTLAYDLYEAFDLEQDLIDRNAVVNPGFFPAMKTLKVLRFS